MKQLIRRVSAILLAAMTAAFAAPEARADSYFPLIRITCVPEASYASIETFGLYNIDDNAGHVPTSLMAQGIYELQELARKPVTCQLRKGTLLVEVLNYHAPRATGTCGGVEDADLRVTLGKEQVALANGTHHGECGRSQRHDIRVSNYEVQHCVLRFEQPTPVVESWEFTPVATTCKRVRLL